MANKKRHMKVKLWGVRTLIILFFAISAITLSQGVVYVQDIVKGLFSSKTEIISERNYDFTSVDAQFDESERIIDEETGVVDTRTKIDREIPLFVRKNSWTDVFSVLSNSWISVIFYVIIAVVILYAVYKLMRKKVTKSEIEQDKQSITKENTDRTEKNKKVMQQWLKRISRTRNITSLYESVRYGEKTYTELDVEKIMKWVEGDGKVDM